MRSKKFSTHDVLTTYLSKNQVENVKLMEASQKGIQKNSIYSEKSGGKCLFSKKRSNFHLSKHTQLKIILKKNSLDFNRWLFNRWKKEKTLDEITYAGKRNKRC